jgi:hypothetical protein
MKTFKRPGGGGELLAIGYDDANLEVIVNMNFDKRLTIKNHDSHFGGINAVGFTKNDAFFVTVGADGLMYLYQFDK